MIQWRRNGEHYNKIHMKKNLLLKFFVHYVLYLNLIKPVVTTNSMIISYVICEKILPRVIKFCYKFKYYLHVLINHTKYLIYVLCNCRKASYIYSTLWIFCILAFNFAALSAYVNLSTRTLVYKINLILKAHQ